MSKTYAPLVDSVAWKAVEYFTTNPDEQLSTQDLEVKFDKPAKQFHSLLGPAIQAGVLKRREGDDGELLYSLGTGCAAIKANKSRNPSLRTDALLAGANLGRKKPEPGYMVQLKDIEIRSDVPMPARRPEGQDWADLLSRLKVKDSFVVPMFLRSQANKACTVAKGDGRGTFTIRKISEEQIGIWRVS
jgi:hypothetical protein